MRLILLAGLAAGLACAPASAAGRLVEAAQALRCPGPSGPMVARLETARAVAAAVIAERETADVVKRYDTAIVDLGKSWSVFQVRKAGKPHPDRHSAWKVESGAGGLEFRIAKCDGMISRLFDDRPGQSTWTDNVRRKVLGFEDRFR
jgi:hypothetical protein